MQIRRLISYMAVYISQIILREKNRPQRIMANVKQPQSEIRIMVNY